ncbi:MAG: ubiquinone/menaquinone biosynthesis methyltransferase [Planctomycetota bacterium]
MTDRPAWTDDLLASPHEAADKASRVRAMFNAIAPRYELVNTVFSAGRDASWRRHAVQLAGVRPDDDVLDVACGTGDFARAFLRGGARSVTGCDFAHEMLLRAAGLSSSSRIEADALRLPFADESFSIVSCAFGVRNFQSLEAGLREIRRVLRPGGRAVILEFTRPTNTIFRFLYEFYAGRIMPAAAAIVGRDRSGAYRYLPRSVVSFLTADEMVRCLQGCGFGGPRATALSWGIVAVYVAPRD